MRNIRCALSAILVIILISFMSTRTCAQQKLSNDKNWIHFNWSSMKLGDRNFDKAAMTVPFTIDGINARFNLQFDLGATSSMLYGNAIDYFLPKYPAIATGLDTLHKPYMLEGKMQGGFTRLQTHLDHHPVAFSNMAYFKGYGDTLTAASFKKGQSIQIGTLGAPYFAGKVLIIDYPNQRLIVVDSLETTTSRKFEFVDCRLENSRIKIPFTIGGSVYWLMFDTGSSLFAIMTNKVYYDKFTGNSPIDSLGISSWGKIIEVYGRKINKPLMFGRLQLPSNYVYMSPGGNFDDFYKNENIIGITGNACFLDKVIAIDFKHKKFGVLKKRKLE